MNLVQFIFKTSLKPQTIKIVSTSRKIKRQITIQNITKYDVLKGNGIWENYPHSTMIIRNVYGMSSYSALLLVKSFADNDVLQILEIYSIFF